VVLFIYLFIYFHAFSHHFCIAYTFELSFSVKKNVEYQKKNIDMDIISNGRVQKKLGHFRKSNNYRELLILDLEVNSF